MGQVQPLALASTALRALRQPRHRIVLACFLATLTAYVERTGFSISYTLLAKAAGVDEGVKGTIMSAFYWGYGVSQVPGGMAAQRFGGRRTLLVCFVTWALASLATPTDAQHTGALAAARVVVGVAQGFLIPAVHTVLSQWIPPNQRAKSVSLTTSGMYLGSAAAMWALPSVAAALGPGALFKVNGMLGLCWAGLWLAVGGAPPSQQQGYIPLTAREASSDGTSPSSKGPKAQGTSTPWRALASQPAMWAIVMNNFTFHYAFYVVMNWLPTYFASRLRTDLASLGAVKTLPYMVMFVSSNAGAWAGDWLITQRHWAVARARKAVNTAGFVSACVGMVWMATARHASSGVLATSAVLGCLGAARGGFSVNHMDIAPKYAGVVMGISNTAGTLAGVVGVAATGWMLEAGGGSAGAAGWLLAFGVSIANCLAGAVVFVACAQGQRVVG